MGAVHKARVLAVKGCAWNDFNTYDLVGKELTPADLVTGDGDPLPPEVIEHFMATGAIVKCEWWVNTSLITACRASPDDDLPRLVYADWITEHGGDAWADAIRTMLARRGNKYAIHDRRTRQHKLIDRLLTEAFPAARPTAFLDRADGCRCVFDRGFIDTVLCPWEWWEQNAAQILDAAISPMVVLQRPNSGSGWGVVRPFSPPLDRLAERWPEVREWRAAARVYIPTTKG